MVHLSPPLDLDALEAFVRVAELRSFTRAAEALGITQSSVSVKVKRLESSLGRRLYQTTEMLTHVRRVTPHERRRAFALASGQNFRPLESLERTPRLVRVAEGCDAFLAASRDLLARRDTVLATLATKERRRLSLGISDQAAGRDLPAVLGGIAAADPDLLLDVHSGASRDLLDRFDGGQFDAVVVRGEDDRRIGKPLLEEA